jgi:hypothetical protein
MISERQGELWQHFDVKSGVRQGDPLSTVLLNLLLEYAVRNITYNLDSTIFSRQHQLLAFAYDICIVARNPRALTDPFNEPETATTKIGLQVNTSQTKYLICISRKVTLQQALAAVKNHIFGRANVFKYLGVLVTTDNVTREIQAWLKVGNRCYYALQAVLKL